MKLIAFARARKKTLRRLFIVAALWIPILFVVNHFWPQYTEESWGWMTMIAALPWSLLALQLPNALGVLVWALGFGLNVVIAATLAWYALSWWLKTLRFDDEV